MYRAPDLRDEILELNTVVLSVLYNAPFPRSVDSVVMENYSFSFFCHFLIKDKHMPVRSTGEPPVTMKLWRRLHCDCQSFKLPYGTSDPLPLERLAMLIRPCH